MPNPIARYFEMSQLSLASYTNFIPLFGNPSTPPSATAVRDALLGDFPFPLANQFAGVTDSLQGFRILSQSNPDDPSGFSATLFQNIETGEKVLAIRGTEPTQIVDILTDINVALLGNPKFSNQYESLQIYIRQLRTDPNLLQGQNFSVTGHSLGGWLGTALSTDAEFKDQIQQVYTYNAPGFNGGFGPLLQLLGVNNSVVDNAKVTNFIAQGPTLIAGAGQLIGPRIDLFIENDGALHDHSVITLTDALAVYDLFGRISSTAELSSVTNILKAASNVATDSLEESVGALHKLFLDQPASFSSEEPARRIDLYERLFAVRTLQQVDGTYQLVDLTSPELSAAVIAGNAHAETPQALAYRYALTELNPFAVFGGSEAQTTTLYAPHRTAGTLDLFNDATGLGTLTPQYLTDRALFLAEKIALNSTDAITSTGNIHFVDAASHYDIRTNSILTTDRQFYFGGNAPDAAIGKNGADRLYGGAGADVLEGHAGDDYLQGDSGNDRLTGGTGTDELWGGTGFDRYYYTTSDGHDRIEDSDATGALFVNGQLLVGGVKRADHTYWENSDGSIRYEMAGTDLVVKLNGTQILTVNENFESGQMGIRLIDASDPNWDNGYPVVIDAESDGFVNNIINYSDTDNLGFGERGNDQLFGNGGNDILRGWSGNDRVYGGMGDDVLDGDWRLILFNPSAPPFALGTDSYYGDDLVDGGEGNDTMFGSWGDDLLYGGAGNDLLYGDHVLSDRFTFTADDFLDGGAGDDELHGMAGDDVLFGGDGLDTLLGDDGNDVLDGGAGDDLLAAGAGNDSLSGGLGIDTLFGDVGDDIADGGAGNDTLTAGQGNDVLVGGADQDLLFGNEGQDVLDGGSGNDELQGGTEADVLWGGTGNDLLFGEDGNDQLFGDEDNDVLVGEAGDDELVGGAGDDQLQGGDGADVLVGGAGNDTLLGGAGADTYVFNLGDGVETIQDAPGEGNRIVFGAGISAADISVGIGSLVVRVGLTNDAIHIQGFDPAAPTVPVGIETFEFADGTMLTQADLVARGFDLVGTADNDVLNGGQLYQRLYGLDGEDRLIGGDSDNAMYGGPGRDVMFGNGGSDQLLGEAGDDVMLGGEGNDALNGDSGNDSLEGESGDDVLVGGAGDDQLLGGGGSDTYRYNLGDGLDSLFDSGPSSDTDTVVFGSGITSSSLSLSSEFGQIVIRVGAGSDGIQSGSVLDIFGSQTIEQFQFADGTSISYTDLVARGFTIDGTEFDDVLFGTNLADRFRSGRGNDRLEGGEGDDTYVFNAGDGLDTIVDTAAPGAVNEIVFGPGITSSAVRLDLASDQSDSSLADLLLRVDTNGDAIQLDTFDRNNVSGPRTVETLRFDDGSVLSYNQLLTRGFDLAGTEGDDVLAGTNIADRILAGDGMDVVRAGAGDDTLDGGAGTDRLFGGEGNDTYVFGPGSGQDTVQEFKGSVDRIRMAPGVAPSAVTATRSTDDLVLSLNGGADRLIVSLYFLGSPLQVERVEFEDGTVWDHVTVEELVDLSIIGTGGSDAVVGTTGDDRLFGLGGDDELAGFAGNDRLDGGAGADAMAGGAGQDTYVVDDAGDVVTELANEGIDTVQSSITTSLVAHVEHLTLTGTAAINGVGNELDNVLVGNSGANVLAGGLGSDTYVVGTGDTVVEAADEGIDTVATDRSYVLGAHLENLTLTGSRSLEGIGNELDNILRGNRSASLLRGGLGNDTYVVGSGNLVVETVDAGNDTIEAAENYTLGANIENLTLLDTFPTLRVGLTLGTGGSVPIGPESHYSGIGNDLNNILTGNRGDNVLDGRGGNDVLDGRGGNDTLRGGAGADTYLFGLGDGQDRIEDQSLSGEIDIVQLGPGLAPNQLGVVQSGDDLVLRMPGSQDSLTLANFFGPSSAAQINVRFQDGTVWDEAALRVRGADPGPGVTIVDADNGDNALIGSIGHDVLTGGSGNDTLIGDGGNDILRDVAGNNVYNGGSGDDSLIGSVGNDIFVFGRGDGRDVVLVDHLFNDPSTTDTDTIELVGLNAGDVVMTNAVTDFGQASFTITVRDTADQLTLLMRNGFYGLAPAPITLSFADGTSLALGFFTTFPVPPPLTIESQVDYALNDGERNLVLLDINSSAVPDPRVGTGNALDNVIVGNTADNVLRGGSGNDVLSGGFARSVESVTFIDTGSDILIGGEGDDTLIPFGDVAFAFDFGVGTDPNPFNTPDDILIGGPGNDTYILNHAQQTVVESMDEGIDTVDSTVTYILGQNVENLVLVDPAAVYDDDDNLVAPPPLDGTGNDLDNLLIGSGKGNLLTGGVGNDTLWGGSAIDSDSDVVISGNDLLVGGLGHDTYVFKVGDEIDTIEDVATAGEGNRILFGAGIAPVDLALTHDPTARTLTIQVGNSGADRLILTNFDPTSANGSLVVGTLAFADGSQANLAALLTPPNQAPTVANPMVDQTVLEDAPFALTIPANTFADVDAGVSLAYSATLAGGAALPAWLSFDPATRTFSGTPLNGDVGTLTLAVTATDTGDLSATSAFALTIQNVNDAPTVANLIPDQQATQGTVFSLVVAANTFADVDVGDTLSYSAMLSNGAALPTWLSFNPATRTFSGTPGNGDTGLITVRVTATDTGNLSGFDVFDLRVNSLDQVLTGTAANDILTGGVGNDQLFGLAGNDTLVGGVGNDLLDGGTGTDTMTGGTGDDTYMVGMVGDVVTELANEGIDTVQSSLTYTLGSNVENLTLTGTAAANGMGNALDNSLIGNSANNTLTGGAGNDRLDGGLGSDTMVGGTGDDTYVVTQMGDVVSESLNQGTDRVESSISYTLGSNVENLVLTGTANISGTGGSANNILVGNSGNNTLDGGSGNDQADGGAGNDLLLGGSGDDQLLGGIGDDTLTAGSGNDLLNGGDGVDSLEGGSGDDQLLGGAGNDTMAGGSGADSFTGGTGNDTMMGGSGNDIYTFLRGDGQDTIIDADPFAGNQDRAIFGATINPLDLVLTRQVNDLRIALHGTTEQVTIQNWYTSPAANQIETVQAGNGQTLLNSQVDQLIQAMAAFTTQTGLTWDQGIDQRPQDVQAVLAGSWQA